jgi:3-oxoacyl-[acyl-carrier protein] reductase
MRTRGWGRIVSIMSSGIRLPIPDLVYSNACRSALQAWLKTIAEEVIVDGVTVNGVIPYRLDTERVATLDKAKALKSGMSVAAVRAERDPRRPIRSPG